MAFTLVTAEGLLVDYGDEAHYRFRDGLLVVEIGDGSEVIYSPHGWRSIVDPDPGSRMNVL
jgi:hypothetical protein